MEDYPMNNDVLLDQMVQRLGAELKSVLEQVAAGTVVPAVIERMIRQQLWQFGAQAMGVMLESADAAAVAGRPVKDRRTRTVVTLFGPVDITRSRCRDGSYPLDEAVGLQGRHGWTTAVQESVSLVSCECGFERTGEFMQSLLGLDIHPPSVQQMAQSAGERVAALPEVSPPQTAAGGTLVMAVDGCQAPQRDGWHEVKVATIYTNESRVRSPDRTRKGRKQKGRGRILHKEYHATLEKAEAFGLQVRRRAEAWEVDKARRVVMMGDGAPWIWTLTADHFPGAVEIVDFYHATEHLWQAGEALFGDRARSVATRSWVRHNRRKLRRGRGDLVLASLQRNQERASSLSAERADVVRRNVEYFRTNLHRMRYAQFRRWRLPIGTGAVEGSCRFVVQSRFKRPGARWSEPGLRHMLALKLAHINHHWETLWPHLKAG